MCTYDAEIAEDSPSQHHALHLRHFPRDSSPVWWIGCVQFRMVHPELSVSLIIRSAGYAEECCSRVLRRLQC